MSTESAIAVPIPALPDSGSVLRERRILAMIVFTIITWGLYVPIWFLRRRSALNQLKSDRKLQLYPFIAIFALLFVEFLAGFVLGFTRDVALLPSLRALGLLVRIGMTVTLVVQAFRVREILEDDLTEKQPSIPSPGTNFGDAHKVSTLLTFFLGIFNLQHVINRRMA
jgi:uncharacterized protein DUF4234